MRNRPVRAIGRFTFLTLCLLGPMPSPLQAQGLTGATVIPAKPTSDGPVRVRIEGEFRDSCPRLIEAEVEESLLTDRGVFTVTVNVRPAFVRIVCLDVITPFAVDVDLGYPSVGLPYQVDVVLVAEDGDKVPYGDMTRFQVDLGTERGLVGARILPSRPFSNTPITLELHGLIMDCIVNVQSMRAELDTPQQRILAVLRVEIPDADCVPHPVDFHGGLAIGTLPPGTYTVDGELIANGDVADTRRFPALGEFEVLPSSGDLLFRRGDVDLDGVMDITDPIVGLGIIFLGDGPFACEDAADTDDSGSIDLTDAIYGLNYLFLGGPAPPLPGPVKPGVDLTADTIGCARPL